ncbi:MAG: hypothetical protein SGPRY_004013 [Prymnesium sp.]
MWSVLPVLAHASDPSCELPPPPTLIPQVLSTRPRAYRITSLLSPSECDSLIQLGLPRLEPSKVGHASSPDGQAWRNSSSMTFSQDDLLQIPLLQRLRRRLSDAALMPEWLAEPLQLSRYLPGESFGLHSDADVSGTVLRTATIVAYLSAGFEGGETVFPRVSLSRGGSLPPVPKLVASGGQELLVEQLDHLDRFCDAETSEVLRVSARQGDALLFFSTQPDGSPDLDSIHGVIEYLKKEIWMLGFVIIVTL